MKRILIIAAVILIGAGYYYFMFVFPKQERKNSGDKKLAAVERNQIGFNNNIIFNDKNDAVKYICEMPVTYREKSNMTMAVLDIVAKRLIIEHSITIKDIGDFIRKNPEYVKVWMAESDKPCPDAYFFYRDKGYYWIVRSKEAGEFSKRSKEPYDLCAEYIIKNSYIEDTDENVSYRRSIFEEPHERRSFRVIFGNAGYNYVFGDPQIQKRLFGTVFE